MKELLQNKVFKKNLKKWLVMYIGVIALFTTIITYSKYMTTMMGSSEAKVAAFDININYLDNQCISSNNCNTGYYRPTSYIEYYFTVDYMFDVKTDVFLTVLINNKFDFEIFDENNEKITVTKNTEKSNDSYYCGSFKMPVTIGSRKTSKYKIRVKYKYDADKNITNEPYNIVKVNYSAKQVQ